MTEEKNDEIASEAHAVIMYSYFAVLSQRRQEAQLSGEEPDEVICARRDLPGYLYEKHEIREKIYNCLIKMGYIKREYIEDELYCFALTDDGEQYARTGCVRIKCD